MVAAQAPVIWEANKGGQWLFLTCHFWEALADGDRGGGKTTALLAIFLSHVGQGYGADWRGILFRLTYPQLKDVVDISRTLIPRAYPDAKFNKNEHEWEFEDGEKLMFRPLENVKAYDSYHGFSIPFLAFEELCNWANSEAYEAMLSCSRLRSDRRDIPRIVRATTNSYGPGHSWVKNRFINGRKPFVPYGEPGRERIRIPIQWRENLSYVAADPDYHVRLAETISNEAQRKAWLENSWDIVAGGRFSDVWLDSVHYIEPFSIPRNWFIDRSFDWGSSKPFCTLWYAESNGEPLEDGRRWPRGTIFVIHEDYGCAGDMNDTNWKPDVGLRLGPTEIGNRVNRNESMMREWGLVSKKPQPGPADDPMFDVSRGASLASQMANSTGVLWDKPSKGRGSRVAGWEAIEDRLRASRKHPMEEPGLFVFDTCVHLRRTLPVLPRDPKNPDDVQSDTEDHCFHGDTKVVTDSGIKMMRDLVGTIGFIKTAIGWQPYYNCRMTRRNQPLVKLIFQDGTEIVCTEDHQILTPDGWKISVDVSDALRCHSLKKEDDIWKSRSSAVRYRSLMGKDTICAGNTSKRMVPDYIEMYGYSIMEKSPMELTYTTSMRIDQTIGSTTLNLCQNQTTFPFIPDRERAIRFPQKPEMRQLDGIKVMMEENGMQNTLKAIPGIYGLRKYQKYALSAASRIQLSRACTGNQDFVQGNAGKDTTMSLEECTLMQNVILAESPSEQENMGLLKEGAHLAGELSQLKLVTAKRVERDDVYCLTVPSTGHFCLDSGVIVKNCADTLKLKILAYSRDSIVRGVSL